GVVVSDVNNDGWPDIYVANDYIENDNLWLNNGNGSFSNCIGTAMRHQSYSSMGVDAADINNDGRTDIMSLDMLPETNERKKMMYSFLGPERYELERRKGYEPAFMRNMLQLNNGVRNLNDTAQPFFSEIGQLAGVQETDWSWSVLMADYDNDGYKDIHITNGFGRDFINSDYIANRATTGAAQSTDRLTRARALMKKLEEYGVRSLGNYCFRNNGDLHFSNVSAEAGFNTPSLSNGCVYADLDNDGDLDLAVNNINQEAFVLRNDLRKQIEDSAGHFISFILKGDSLNKKGIGANIKIFTGGGVQFLEQYPIRGYASSVDQRIHAGLGKTGSIDSITITWPDRTQQILKNITVDQFITIDKRNAGSKINKPVLLPFTLFEDATERKQVDFRHRDDFFYDYGFQRLLPQKYSQSGPFIATADVNGDGLQDFFVGGAFQQSGQIFIQRPDGTFAGKDLEAASKQQEDLGVIFFDADGDGDQDLFINSGSIEFDAGSVNYHPRLFQNDGKGNFSLNVTAIPQSVNTSAQAVAAADFDGDGDLDLFIGGRISINQYPASPRSYILQNNGGNFSDVTADICESLIEPGMITDAIWTDFNNDKNPDLIITGEWMPVRFFENKKGKLIEVTNNTGLDNNTGFWRSICAADIDNDGDLDYVTGNLGLNNKFKADKLHPVKLFSRDIDGNGSTDPIIAYYIINEKGDRKLYPSISRDQLAEQVPSIKKQYLKYADYSIKTMDELFTDAHKNDANIFTCEETRTSWLENKGDGKFVKHALPAEAQLSPVNSIVCTDVDGDGSIDIIMAGNEYQAEVSTGRYDASYGIVLKGDGKGGFTSLPYSESGFIIEGDVKNLQLISNSAREKLLLAAVNNDKAKIFTIHK
ncbi:MAG: VCBS repeat-containing protein, partial [Flavitalea sp.]